MNEQPIAVDLFTGLHGWGEGFVAEGFKVIGVDLVDMRKELGQEPLDGLTLLLQDILTLHGSQFKDAAVIVASPPCTEYSYMAMPWKRAKQIAAALRGDSEHFPSGYNGSRTIEELNALFNACFRIQREASEVAGRHIPMIVENVKGAQPWVGRAQAHFGSFYLWGDVGQVGNRVVVMNGQLRDVGVRPRSRTQKVNPDGTGHPAGSWFAIANSKNRGAKSEGQDWSRFAKTGEVSPHWRMEGLKGAKTEWQPNGQRADGRMVATDEIKNNGGSWFNVAHNTESGKGQNPDGRKVSGDWFGTYEEMKTAGTISPGRLHGKNSAKRKAASALIAKIPFPLSRYIASQFRTQPGRSSCDCSSAINPESRSSKMW